MALPQWVQEFKEPRTEIKHIKGGYYKYKVSYKYNKEKGRTDKITGILLGKITKEDGFVPSEKNKLREGLNDTKIDIKSYGLYKLFFSLLDEEFSSLKEHFSVKTVELLFSFAMYRWAYNTPIKRAPHYYNHDYCSQEFSKKKITDKEISAMLKLIGENRDKVVKWMRSMLGEQSKKDNFVLMDSTHVSSKSELLTVNAKGYNPNFDFDEQIRLMYLFSAERQKPVYYRLINGNIPDVTSMKLSVKEMEVNHVIYIADKGFYSKDNIKEMKKAQLQYIIPLHRNNKIIDFIPLKKADFKQHLSYFTYKKRIIWFYKYKKGKDYLVTFLDGALRSKEETDYVNRIDQLPERYTTDKFEKKLTTFGTLTFVYNIKETRSCEEIYQAYKQRNEVEIVFDAYKNFLQADVMYMQDRYVAEGWLMSNFIAMLAYHKLFVRMRNKKKLKKHSPKDIIELSKSIYKLKIKSRWRTSEITKKSNALFKLLEIDYLN